MDYITNESIKKLYKELLDNNASPFLLDVIKNLSISDGSRFVRIWMNKDFFVKFILPLNKNKVITLLKRYAFKDLITCELFDLDIYVSGIIKPNILFFITDKSAKLTDNKDLKENWDPNCNYSDFIRVKLPNQ